MHFLRQLLKGWVGKLAIAIISLTFIISLFAGSIVAQGAKGEAMVIGDQVITVNQIKQRVEDQKSQWRQRMGEQANETLINSLVNEESIKRELMDEGLLRNYANQAGIIISKETIDGIIVGQSSFLDDKGEFSSSLYSQMLRNNGISDGQYREYISQSLVLSQLRQGFGTSSFDVAKQHELAHKLNEQTRDFSYVVLERDTFKDDISVSDEEVLTYYNANPERFKTQETAVFDYVRLDKAALEQQIEVTEDDIQLEYENLVATWKTQEQRQIATIQLDKNSADFEEKKAAIEQGIEAATDFATLVQEYSDDVLSAQNGGDLGFIAMGVLGDNFDEMAFSLEPGTIGGPVEEGDMVYFAQVSDIKAADIKPLEDVMSDVTENARIRKAEDVFSEQEVVLDERVYDDYALEDIAQELGLSVENSGSVPVSGGFGWLSDPEFVASLNTPEAIEDMETQLARLSDGSLVAYKVSEHKAAEPKALDSVKATIGALIKDEKASDVSKQRAEELVARLQAGSDLTLAELAEQMNLSVETKAGVKRSATEVAHDITKVAFKGVKPALGELSYTSGELASSNYIVLELSKVAEPTEPVTESSANQINGLRAAEDGMGMLSYMREHTKIKEFENNLEGGDL